MEQVVAVATLYVSRSLVDLWKRPFVEWVYADASTISTFGGKLLIQVSYFAPHLKNPLEIRDKKLH